MTSIVIALLAPVAGRPVAQIVPIFMAWMLIDPPFWGPQKVIDRIDTTNLCWMIVVAGIVMQNHSLTLFYIYVIGLVFSIAALTSKFSPHHWLYMALITPTIVCLTASASTRVANLGKQRVVDTLVGAGLALIAAALTIGYLHHEGRRGSALTPTFPVTLGRV